MGARRLFSLVIGIDYDGSPHIRNLKGAVADADAIAKRLKHNLKVVPSRMINLRNKEASRKNILKALKGMRGNSDILHGDPIFIYYAGHGGEATPPASDGWKDLGETIQTIIPWDMRMDGSNGEIVPPIPDRTIGILLTELAEEKGDNITVVFDCCHSTSGARDSSVLPKGLERALDKKVDLPPDIDRDIFVAHAQYPRKLVDFDQKAFVMLAACGATEKAREDDGHGLFTTKFLAALERGVENKTYTQFIETLPNIPGQTPQCEGYHKNRFFFNGKAPGRHPTFIPVEPIGATYKLKAGKAQGITVDCEFTIHDDPTIPPGENPALCRMRSTSVECFHATLNPVGNTVSSFPNPAYALQVRNGKDQTLRVHYTPALMKLLKPGVAGVIKDEVLDAENGIYLVGFKNTDLVVDVEETVDGKKATFSHMALCKYGLKRIPCLVPPTDHHIKRVLRAVARWNWHMKRGNEVEARDMEIKFKRLEKRTSFGGERLEPVGDISIHNGTVDLEYNASDYFGVEILNKTPYDLYAYVFWFDSDQSIQPLYCGLSGRDQVDPSLLAGKSFTVGYGAIGVESLRFNLKEHDKHVVDVIQNRQEMDVGFLKIFLTNFHADFTSIAEQSPFKRAAEKTVEKTSDKPGGQLRDLDTTPVNKPPQPQWHTLTTAVVVKRKGMKEAATGWPAIPSWISQFVPSSFYRN